jgi:uncharacterized membrane protein
MAKKKFDTNPLDPEFPQKVMEAQTNALPQTDAATQKFADPSDAEVETRQFNQANFGAYQAPYNGQNVPASYQAAAPVTDVGKASKRKVAKIGLPENIMTALPYLPIWLGLVVGILELVFLPKSEAKVRFHAAQAAAAHIGILIILAILGTLDFLPFGNAPYKIFWVVSTVMLVVFAIKAYQGKPVHIEPVEDLTEWLEDKIKPKK